MIIFYKKKLVDKIIFLLFLTSSFDIFLNIRINHYTIRIFYFLELFLLFFLFKKKYLRFPFFKYILLWVFTIILFIPNTTLLTRNLGYSVWLILSILLIVIFSSLIKSRNQFYKIFDYYILSFKIIALFGLFQFIMGFFGIYIYVTQKFFPHLIRINGFSYEPSYFGTYMLIGWWILLYFYQYKKFLFKKYQRTFTLITFVILLSTSRMSILFMIISFFSLLILDLIEYFLRLKILKKDLKALIFLFFILISVIFILYYYWDYLKFLLSGLGIFGESSHSTTPRIEGMMETFETFLKSPIIGYSLGGIPSAIAELKGITITTQIEAKHFEGTNIFLEILSASGIIGFIFFILYLFNLFKKSNLVAKRLYKLRDDFYIYIKALRFALFWEFLILSLNQNILRPYVWILIALLSTSLIIGKASLYYEIKYNNRLQNA